MPIDATLIGRMQPAPAQIAPPNPLEFAQTLGQIENVRAQVDARRLAADKARQDAADRAAMQQALVESGGDPLKALPKLYQVAPVAAAALDQKVQEAIKERAAGALSEYQLKDHQLSTSLKLLQGRTPENWPVLRQAIVGISKDVDGWLPKEYDEQQLNAIEQMGLTAAEKNKANLESTQLYLKGDYHGALSRSIGAINPAAPDAQAQFDRAIAAAHAGRVPQAVIDEFGTVATPEAIAHAQQLGVSPEKRAEINKPVAVQTTDAQGNQVTQFVVPKAGDVYAKPDEHSPAYKEWQDYQKQGGTLDFNAYQTMDANRKAIRVNAGQGNPGDIKDVVQGMMDGTLPPQLPGRASPMYTAIMAEAQRRGYNLAQAATDWTATQKHIATMNGAQQLRLNQSINALPEMLDKVDTLAQQWKGTGAPLLNRANLALAKNGVYGKQAATIANQLDSQIADVVADLGNVYMGGNSPTDHALELAGKSLKADWSESVLRDMVALARTNVKIRRNSINNTGVAGASADNPYAPQPAPAAAAPPAAATGGAGALTYQDYLKSRGGR